MLSTVATLGAAQLGRAAAILGATPPGRAAAMLGAKPPLRTAATLRVTRLARAAAMPEQVRQAPAQTALLEGVRQRNAILDALFYDIGVVNHAEAVAISPWLAAEGALLIVPPSKAGTLTLCPTIDDFVAAGGQEVRTLAIAGVGSSALGSAAFARNIADATGQKVAAVVSGYGMADVAAEALGGFFWFGGLNSLRHLFEGLDRATEADHAVEASIDRTSTAAALRLSRDTKTVLALLADQRFGFELLAGHSKGNLVLSEALYQLEIQDAERVQQLAESTRIVTVSARIAMPLPFRNVIDVMGAWDWFGGLNSRANIAPDVVVPAAWHHTNTELPAHLPVTRTLKSIL